MSPQSQNNPITTCAQPAHAEIAIRSKQPLIGYYREGDRVYLYTRPDIKGTVCKTVGGQTTVVKWDDGRQTLQDDPDLVLLADEEPDAGLKFFRGIGNAFGLYIVVIVAGLLLRAVI